MIYAYEIAQYSRDQRTQKQMRSIAKWQRTYTYLVLYSLRRTAFDAIEGFKEGFKASLGFFGILALVAILARHKPMCLLAVSALTLPHLPAALI